MFFRNRIILAGSAARSVFPAMVLVFGLVLASPQAQAVENSFGAGAKSLVSDLVTEVLISYTDKSVDKSYRREKFKSLLNEYFAFKSIAKWVLGRYWRKASKGERQDFLVLFEKLMVLTYAQRLEKYGGETLSFGEAEVKGKNVALIHTTLERPNGLKPIQIIWRVRLSKDKYKIVDVMVEGLSMGLAQQKEYASVIRQHGGKVSGLLEQMKNQIQSLEKLE